MSNPDDEQQNESPPSEVTTAAASASAEPASARGSSWVGGFALLVALAAAAGVGYLWYEQQRSGASKGEVAGVQTAVEAQADELARLGGMAQAWQTAEQRLTNDVQNLSGPLERQLDEIPLRIQRLERALREVPGVADKARSAWLLAETEYFLRIANSQLSLAGNPDVALAALNIADEKLRDMADPRLTPVRAALSDERAALRAVPKVDAEGIVLQLGSLARNIDRFPLADGLPARFGGDGAGAGTESGWDRALRVIKEALSNLISIKKSTEVAVAPVMSAADEIILRRALDMEMQIARLAAMRNQGDLFRGSIDSIADRLTRYFDADDASVSAALSTLEELGDAKISADLPDISGSLALLLELGPESASP